MKIKIPYIPPNWNAYIKEERTSKYKANQIKQNEKQFMMWWCKGKKYEGNYPVELTFKPHYSNMRQDLDNFRYKGLLDGLVASGVIKNDNLRHIQKITIEPVFDDEKCVEIEIKEIEK